MCRLLKCDNSRVVTAYAHNLFVCQFSGYSSTVRGVTQRPCMSTSPATSDGSSVSEALLHIRSNSSSFIATHLCFFARRTHLAAICLDRLHPRCHTSQSLYSGIQETKNRCNPPTDECVSMNRNSVRSPSRPTASPIGRVSEPRSAPARASKLRIALPLPTIPLYCMD